MTTETALELYRRAVEWRNAARLNNDVIAVNAAQSNIEELRRVIGAKLTLANVLEARKKEEENERS